VVHLQAVLVAGRRAVDHGLRPVLLGGPANGGGFLQVQVDHPSIPGDLRLLGVERSYDLGSPVLPGDLDDVAADKASSACD
jgi:hypothetical protein